MLPMERQQRIKELITTHQSMKISELSKALHVSEMTIHRDLKPLLDQEFIIKTFGGIMLATQSKEDNTFEKCIICNQPVHPTLNYRLILTNNELEMACCSHCGLIRHQQLGDRVIQSICHDFLHNTAISAPLAWYVVDTSINMGCCQPQVLPFEWKEHAEGFIKGFGGNIYSFNEVSKVIAQKMKG